MPHGQLRIKLVLIRRMSCGLFDQTAGSRQLKLPIPRTFATSSENHNEIWFLGY